MHHKNTDIEFWFEFASTYSYPAALLIESRAASHGFTVVWKPFLLGPIFKEQGWNDSPFNIYAAKGRYMWRDLARTCRTHKLPYQQPSVFPRNGLLAARVACRFAGANWLPEFIRDVYRANFQHDLDIADPAVIKSCLAGSGEDIEMLLRQAQTDTAKSQLKEQTAIAVERGIFGAPSFIVGDELFWGFDRLDAALESAGAST